ncbi:Bcr/CflA family efflux MFS transporter [Roseibium hamelinense]|nr:multidrug effflux MFS transporter [Roseibium hamelinense]MTI42355.1 Bcr/CflA family efflux MFS transporter [Roseibium hamelinense]
MSADFTGELAYSGKVPVKRTPSLGVLIAISTVSPVAINIYLPSLAGMVTAFDTTAAQIQLTMSLFLVAVAVAQLIVGPLSDRYGRRPVVIAGMALFVAGSALCLMAPDVETLIFARMVQAVGGCTGLVLGRAIVRDLYERDRAAGMIGYVTMGMTVGPMAAPALGGLLDSEFGWRGGFYMMLVMGGAVLMAAIVNLHETNHQRSATGGLGGLLRNYRTLAKEKLFWAYALTAMFTSSVYFSYLGGAPFIAADVLGMGAAEMGLYFMFVAAGYIIGNGISGRITERVGVVRMILAGSLAPSLAVFFVGLAIYVDWLHPLTLFLPMFFVGLGNGICLPSAISGAVSARPELAGAAAGLSGSMQVGFGALTSALVAWAVSETMWPGSVWPMVAVMLFCVLATAACVAAVLRLENQAVA